MIHSRSNTSIFHHANTPLLVTLVILILTAGCDRLPGKPNREERWRPATEVTDFSQLYAQNCSGCHGAEGRLGEKQIDALVEGMRSRWGKGEDFKNVAMPPYNIEDAISKGGAPGDQRRGAVVYQTYCAQCHGKDGSGGAKGGSVINSDYLALVSDQALRTTVIVGRSDLSMPDWRGNVPGRALGPQEISDVVA